MPTSFRNPLARLAALVLVACAAASAAEPMVRGGGAHALYLDADGTVFSWGNGSFGQLGAGSIVTSRSTPGLSQASHIQAIAAGGGFSLALKSDGTVLSWGLNDVGQLGIGSVGGQAFTPVQVKTDNVNNIIAIAAGKTHALALRADGTVWAWGGGASGQLGNAANTNSAVPVEVLLSGSPLQNIIAIAGGTSHSLAVRADGFAFSWGDDTYGQLGDDSSFASKSSAVQVSSVNITNAMAVAAGEQHSYILRADGTVWAMGADSTGALGNDAANSGLQALPVQVAIGNVTAIASGLYTGYALSADGTVKVWGQNDHGQVGDGSTTNRFLPVDIGLSQVRAIGAGQSDGYALISNGRMRAWGAQSSGSGSVGNGGSSDVLSPTTESAPWPLVGIVSVKSGTYYSLALRADGTVWAWGSNTSRLGIGQLGVALPAGATSSDTAVQVTGVGNVVRIAASAGHSVALTASGSVYTWGSDFYGEIGDGTASSSSAVGRTSPFQVPGLANVRAIGAGCNNTMAIRADGTLMMWGDNGSGECGQGATSGPYTSPIAVPGLPPVMAVDCGYQHVMAAGANGFVYVWGADFFNQLGDGSSTTRSSPLNLGFALAKEVEAGQYHSMLLTASGGIYTWGYDAFGQIGNGTVSSTAPYTPITFLSLTNVAHISNGSDFGDTNLALIANGTIKGWGRNDPGMLSTGNNANQPSPIAYNGQSGVVAVAEGDYLSTVLRDDGTLAAAGDDSYGELDYSLSTSQQWTAIACDTAWLPTVTLVTTDGSASETGPDSGSFLVQRNSAFFGTLTVQYAVSGTATSGSDYNALSGTVTIPDGVSGTTITVTPIDDDFAEDPETVIATLSGGAQYNKSNASFQGTVTIADNDTASVVVNAAASLQTTEAGGQATFTIVLTSRPTADVTINLSSTNTNEGTVSPSSVTFFAASSTSWKTAQTVTITGVDDFVADGNVAYTITTSPAISADPKYANYNPPDVSVTNLDNDSAGVIITAPAPFPLNPISIAENGGTSTFTIKLNSQPTAPVTIALSSTDTTRGTVSPTSVTIQPTSGGLTGWNVPQTVTVTGVNDDVASGNQPFTIVTAPATSADNTYNGWNAQDVAYSRIDDDSKGFTVSTPTNAGHTTESGGSVTFTVKMTSQPTGNVTLPFHSTNTAEGTVSPASLTFSPSGSNRWDIPQTVTVTGVDDQVIDGNVAYAIAFDAVTGTNDYTGVSGLLPANVSLVNDDNDVAKIVVTPSTGLVTSESDVAQGTFATFTISLATKPTANVTIGLSSDTPSEGTVSPASVTFTPTTGQAASGGTSGWNVAQTITVTGVDDAVNDGDQVYHILTGPITTTDANYGSAGLTKPTVTCTNKDNDRAGVVVAPTSGLITTEAGGSATFTVSLTTPPLNQVDIAVTSTNTGEGTVSPGVLHFDNTNYNVAQTVTVTGVDDSRQDGDVAYSVTGSVTSADNAYNGLAFQPVSVTNTDDDARGVIVTPTFALSTTEAGGIAVFTVRLATQPFGVDPTVGITLTSTNAAEGSVSPAALSFDATNWNVPQIVTVTGVDDDVADGDQFYSILTGTCTGNNDYGSNGVKGADVQLVNLDDDAKGVSLLPVNGTLQVAEGGATDSYDVSLDSQPTSNVTITIGSARGQVTTNPTTLTFTPANWWIGQSVQVTAIDDHVCEGDHTDSLTHSVSGGDYDNFPAGNLSVSITDNDEADIVVSPISGNSYENGSSIPHFTLHLATKPTANVTFLFASSNPAEGVPSTSRLTFTPIDGDWDVDKTVDVIGVDDRVQDGDQAYKIVIQTVSADGNYDNWQVAAGIPLSVDVVNVDDDVAGVVAGPGSLTTSESGATASFQVVLSTQPVANVTVAVSAPPATEGTLSASSLIFTPANWFVPQSITVTGVDDAVADGPQTYSLNLSVSSGGLDPHYAPGLVPTPASITVTNNDNDIASVLVTPTSGLTTTEAGGTATFSVVLTSQPTGNVDIPTIDTDNHGEGLVSPTALTFTPANWNVPQVVMLTGVDDNVVDGPIVYHATLANTVSTDPNYNNVVLPNVTATNQDDDIPGITVAITGPDTAVNERPAGAGQIIDHYSVVLATQPSGTVTVTASRDAGGHLQLSKDGGATYANSVDLIFDATTWNAPQTVTVEAIPDGTPSVGPTYIAQITHAVSAPGVAGYSSITTASPVDVTVTDDKAPTLTIVDGQTIGGITYPDLPVTRAATLSIQNTDLAATDAENNAPAAITYHLLLPPGQGTLYAPDMFGTPQPLAAGDTFTQADIDAGNLVYVHGGSTTPHDGFAFDVSDDGGNSTGLSVFTMQIDVSRPSVTLAAGSVAYLENAPPVFLDATATVADADSPDLGAGGTPGQMVIDIPAGAQAQDVLSLHDVGSAIGQLHVVTTSPGVGTISVSGTPVAAWTGGLGGALTVGFLSPCSPANAQSILQNLQYSFAGEAPGPSKTVRVVVTDETGLTSVAVTRAIAITAVDDPPRLEPVPGSAPTTVPQTIVTAAGVAVSGSFTIADDDDATVTLTVGSQGTRGTVSGLTPSVTGALGSAQTVSFTYTPTVGQVGADAFSVHAVDASGGATDFTVNVVIVGNGAIRPWIVSDPPMEMDQAGSLAYTLSISLADYGGGTPAPATLSYSFVLLGSTTSADATVTFSDGTVTAASLANEPIATPVTLRVQDASGVAPRFIQIGVLVTDTANNTTGYQPLTIHVVPAGGGGG